jgi:hypothetical protein
MRHLEEEQVGELIGVLECADTIVPEYVAESPKLLHEIPTLAIS